MLPRVSILALREDEPQRPGLWESLSEAGYEVLRARGPREGLEMLEAGTFDVVLCDLDLRAADGVELVSAIRRLRPLQVVVVTVRREAAPRALEAMRRGAFHYLTKPVTREELLITLQRATERSRLLRENRRLRSELDSRYAVAGIVGRHGGMEEVLRLIRKVAPTATTVMIYGESGTGKELIARAIHRLSPRAERPIYAINCAAMPDALLESELFGYEKGAFTGAYTRKRGIVETASGSTLLLDEVGDLGPPLQAKLLRVLQEREIRRLGSSESISVDLRVISASHRDLAGMVAQGTFRQDLFYRLNTFPITVPPLRLRRLDVPLLVEHFLGTLAERQGIERPRLAPAALERLLRYDWPGNVRQLESALERALILAEGGVVEEGDLPEEVLTAVPRAGTPYDLEIPDEGIDLGEVERRLLVQAMEKSGWVVARAAPLLGLTYRTLQYRLGKHSIEPKARRRPQDAAAKRASRSGASARS